MTEATRHERAGRYDYGRLFRLDGRRALVVGAGAGIGQATARGLSAFGAEVICADRDLNAANATAYELDRSASPAEGVELDVSRPNHIARAINALGPVDVLVVTAAVNVRKLLLDTKDEEFDQVIGVNLKGTYRLMRAFAAGMAARGGGSLIAFSSFRAVAVEAGQGLYAASKAGTVQLVRALAEELGERNVRVNAVAPGPVETPLTAPIKDMHDWYEAYRTKTALRRWAQPSEIVGAVIYLASDAGSYTTGAVLTVDGGWTAVDGRFWPPLGNSR